MTKLRKASISTSIALILMLTTMLFQGTSALAVRSAATSPTLSVSSNLANRRYVASGDRAYDLGSEDREGAQDSTVSVFTRDRDGTLRHFYSAHPGMAPDIRERGLDLLEEAHGVRHAAMGREGRFIGEHEQPLFIPMVEDQGERLGLGDRLREEIAARGWEVRDTAQGHDLVRRD